MSPLYDAFRRVDASVNTRPRTHVQFKIALPEESFHSYRCDAPLLEVDVSKDELMDMYTKMVRIRWPSSIPVCTGSS